MCQWSRYATFWRSHRGRRSSCSRFSSVRRIIAMPWSATWAYQRSTMLCINDLHLPETGRETRGAPLQGSNSSRLVVSSGRSRQAQNSSSNSCSRAGHRGHPLRRLPALRSACPASPLPACPASPLLACPACSRHSHGLCSQTMDPLGRSFRRWGDTWSGVPVLERMKEIKGPVRGWAAADCRRYIVGCGCL